MGCNAHNHPLNCDCGWGGVYYSGSVEPDPGLYVPYFESLKKRKKADPNASCPVCGQKVFFFESPEGGRVFFDDLGDPWPKHPCTDSSLNGASDDNTDDAYTHPIMAVSGLTRRPWTGKEADSLKATRRWPELIGAKFESGFPFSTLTWKDGDVVESLYIDFAANLRLEFAQRHLSYDCLLSLLFYEQATKLWVVAQGWANRDKRLSSILGPFKFLTYTRLPSGFHIQVEGRAQEQDPLRSKEYAHAARVYNAPSKLDNYLNKQPIR